jgi:hypothetical protein
MKRLFKPIMNLKIGNPAEFLFIIRYQNAADREGMGGDEHVKRANGGALVFQVGPQPAIVCCGVITIGHYFQRSYELGQGDLIPFRFRAFGNIVFKLAQGYGRDTNLGDPGLPEPFEDIRWLFFDDVDTCVGIEHVSYHNDFRECWAG